MKWSPIELSSPQKTLQTLCLLWRSSQRSSTVRIVDLWKCGTVEVSRAEHCRVTADQWYSAWWAKEWSTSWCSPFQNIQTHRSCLNFSLSFWIPTPLPSTTREDLETPHGKTSNPKPRSSSEHQLHPSTTRLHPSTTRAELEKCCYGWITLSL